MSDQVIINSGIKSYGAPPTGGARLPDVPNSAPYRAPFLDRLGEQVQHLWLPILGGVGATSLLVRQAVRSTSTAGRIGAAVAAAPAAVVGALLASGAGALVAGRGERQLTRPSNVPVADPTVRRSEDLKVMTYNLHGGMGTQNQLWSDEAKLDRLAEAIRREDPDIVVVQEADAFAARSNYHDTMRELQERLHPDSAVMTPRGTMATGRQEGTGILTFHGNKVEDARGIVAQDPYGDDLWRRFRTSIPGAYEAIRHALQPSWKPSGARTPDYVPRVTTDAMVVTPSGNHVRVLGGHYSWPIRSTDYPSRQIPVVGDATIPVWSGPTVWAADWNTDLTERDSSVERATMQRLGMHDAFQDAGIKPGDTRRNSFGDRYSGPIDRIYTSSRVTTSDAHVSHEPSGTPAGSDHHPVVTTVHLSPSE